MLYLYGKNKQTNKQTTTTTKKRTEIVDKIWTVVDKTSGR